VARTQLVDSQKAERTQHGDEGEGVDQEHPPGADAGDEPSRERRADHAGGIEGCGIESHCIRKIWLIDQLTDERLPRRRIERRGASEQKREQIHVPQPSQAGDNENAETGANTPIAAWVQNRSFLRSR
jgi:hypothetical protein